MKLIEIIKYLLHRDKLEEFYQKYRLNQESEALLIYMKESIDLESEITILELEETQDEIFFNKEGAEYISFFPINHAVDLIEFDLQLKGKKYSDLEIANRLIDYRKNDA